MTDIYQEIRDQIHELRNVLAPVDFRLANFQHEIEECRTFFKEKAVELEAKVEEQGARISNIIDRLLWIEMALNVPPKPEPGKLRPINGEKITQPPAQNPAHK